MNMFMYTIRIDTILYYTNNEYTLKLTYKYFNNTTYNWCTVS